MLKTPSLLDWIQKIKKSHAPVTSPATPIILYQKSLQAMEIDYYYHDNRKNQVAFQIL